MEGQRGVVREDSGGPVRGDYYSNPGEIGSLNYWKTEQNRFKGGFRGSRYRT